MTSLYIYVVSLATTSPGAKLRLAKARRGTMTNVFTRKYHKPRTTTLLDFNGNPPITITQRSCLSPTRRGNPHPEGLRKQNIPSEKTFMIWNPDFGRKRLYYPQMMEHLRKVNFTCKTMTAEAHEKRIGKVPVIKFCENTESRSSYRSPSEFPKLMHKAIPVNKYQTASTGIVPNLVVPEYLPVVPR